MAVDPKLLAAAQARIANPQAPGADSLDLSALGQPAPVAPPVASNPLGMDLTGTGLVSPGQVQQGTPTTIPGPAQAPAVTPQDLDTSVNNVVNLDSGAPTPAELGPPPGAAPPPKKIAQVALTPGEYRNPQTDMLNAAKAQRDNTQQALDLRHQADVQGAEDARNSVSEGEALFRQRQANEVARQETLREKASQLENVKNWGLVNNTFASFFDGQRRMTAGILAAGLYRAGKPEHAIRTLESAMAHEYDGQKQALAQSQANGQQATNSLAQYRSMFADEREADLAWELEGRRLIANRAKAAYATAKTAEEKASNAAIINGMDYKIAELEDKIATSFTVTDNASLLKRNSADPNAGPPNVRLAPGPTGVPVPVAAPNSSGGPSAPRASNPPQIQANGQPGYPSLQAAQAKVSGKPVTEAKPVVRPAAQGLSATDAARQAPLGSRVVATEGRFDEGWDAANEIFASPGKDGKKETPNFKRSASGSGWVPKNMEATKVNGRTYIGPEAGYQKVAEATVAFNDRALSTANMNKDLSALLAKKADWSLGNNLDYKKRKELEADYQRLGMSQTALASDWWRQNVDNSVIKADERERLEKLIPNLSTFNGLLGASQRGDIEFLKSITDRVAADNAKKAEAAIAAYGYYPSREYRLKVDGPEVDPRTGKPTGRTKFHTDMQADSSRIIHLPGHQSGKSAVETRGTQR